MDYVALQQIFLVISMVWLLFTIASDILPVFFKTWVGRLISYLCIGMHVVMMPLMLLAAMKLEAMILSYAVSLFAYTLARYVTYCVDRRKRAAAPASATVADAPTENGSNVSDSATVDTHSGESVPDDITDKSADADTVKREEDEV